jgi:hypothetical protein
LRAEVSHPLDLDAIAAVARSLNLTRPLTITLTKRKLGGKNGGQRYAAIRWFGDGEHRITVNTDRPPEHLTPILLHELAHCSQAEQHGADWPKRYRAAKAAAPSYSDNMYEVEADAFAELLSDVRLVKP